MWKQKALTLTTLASITILGLSGCGQSANGVNTATTSSSSRPAYSASSVNTNAKQITETLTISPDGPKYTPANFTLPPNTVVNFKIIDKDNGAATIPSGYIKVRGTIDGTMVVNGKKVSELDAKNVAHTLTFPSLNLNVPVPPSATVAFSIKTPRKPGNYTWQCYAACGSGQSGWGGVMSQMGAMQGTLTVKA